MSDEQNVQPEAEAPENVAEAVADENSAVVITPEPVPVITRTPSSDSPTQRPEVATEAGDAPYLADAARNLLTFVKAHRTAGDSDLEAAVADVEAALASRGT